MEIACVIDCRLATPSRPGRTGGSRPGRDSLPDPVEAAELTEAAVRALESIGAAVESERSGEAFFAVDGLRGIHGGGSEGVLAGAREAVEGALGARGAFPVSCTGNAPRMRIATAPTRFAAFAAARRGAFLPDGWEESALRIRSADLRAFLDPLPVAFLPARFGAREREAGEMVVALERLGIETLGALARLSPDQVADRFGALGLRALRLARGEDEPLRPRTPHEELAERIELPEGTAGRQLDRALELLVDRLLAAPQRRGRTLLGLRLGALLCGGGSWSVEQGLGRPSASAAVLRRLLAPRLEALPGPAAALRLRALGFGPPVGDQLELAIGGVEPRRRRLGAAVREVRAAQGPEALLRILPVDAASRVPERWAMLTPFPEL
jgi:protein ImuB